MNPIDPNSLLSLRLDRLQECIGEFEARMLKAEEDPSRCVSRVKKCLKEFKVYTASFQTVVSDYYDRSLIQRADILRCDVNQLCKTIIFQNTLCEHNICSDITDSKYYCVIVQYCERVNAEKLRDFIHKLSPIEKRMPKNKLHFRLAEESCSRQLSGFVHNAVSPIGMTTPIPTIICKSCANVTPSFIWLGGGAVDVKLCISLSDLIYVTSAIIADISEPR